MSRAGHESGFALVEALAALAVVGMMSLLLLQGVTTGRRIWEARSETGFAQDSVFAAQTTLRAWIERMFLQGRFDSNAPYVDVEGTAAQLNAAALEPGAGRLAVPQRFRLEVRSGDLVLDHAPDFGEAPLFKARTRTVLKDVRSVELAYFGRKDRAYQGGWTSRWQERPTAPALIRVRVRFEDGDLRRWPDLYIAPRANVDNACVLDRNLGRCRGRL